MAQRSAPELPFRLGCPLALLVAVLLVAAVEWLVYGGRPYRPDNWESYAFQAAFLGAPFAVLALARVRDWLAWAAGIALTAAAWGYLAYDLSLHRGANIVLGFAFLFTPLAIAVGCLVIAGMRGRIAWALERDDPPA